MSQSEHKFAGFKECTLFNSCHEYARGYNMAICICGWKSPGARTEAALMVMYLEHRADNQAPLPVQEEALLLLQEGKDKKVTHS